MCLSLASYSLKTAGQLKLLLGWIPKNLCILRPQGKPSRVLNWGRASPTRPLGQGLSASITQYYRAFHESEGVTGSTPGLSLYLLFQSISCRSGPCSQAMVPAAPLIHPESHKTSTLKRDFCE